MSNKITCPGCGSHTSNVWQAIEDGEPCPHCGLPSSTIVQVNAVRDARGDERLREQLAEALVRAGRAEALVAVLRDAIVSAHGPLDRALTAIKDRR